MIAIVLFFSKLFSRKQDDEVVDSEAIDFDAKRNKRSPIHFLLLVAVLAGILLFVLPRFGISLIGLLQKVVAFLPLIRGLLPF